MKGFKIGDKVKYISQNYGDEACNPLWGGMYGKIKGKIDYVSLDYKSISVLWDNGKRNSYHNSEIKLINEQEQLNLF